jgi:hypothetical protein
MDGGPSLVSFDFLERQPTVCENKAVRKQAASKDLAWNGRSLHGMEWNVHRME